ncbi:MAG: hypothetical protein IPJ88_18625 [Myxococcales bacterium]|nr:MAG: hypothetical protein IPJ88_18625 [Myxococcales bacterium]
MTRSKTRSYIHKHLVYTVARLFMLSSLGCAWQQDDAVDTDGLNAVGAASCLDSINANVADSTILTCMDWADTKALLFNPRMSRLDLYLDPADADDDGKIHVELRIINEGTVPVYVYPTVSRSYDIYRDGIMLQNDLVNGQKILQRARLKDPLFESVSATFNLFIDVEIVEALKVQGESQELNLLFDVGALGYDPNKLPPQMQSFALDVFNAAL